MSPAPDPPTGSRSRFGHPQGVEQVLLRAARDPDFRAELKSEGAEAASRRGIELRDSERAVLAAIPPHRLDEMIETLTEIHPSDAGPERVEAVLGSRPDPIVGPPQGIRPDLPPERPGTRRRMSPAASVALAAGAVAVGTTAVVGTALLRGCRADMPPAALPTAPTESRQGAAASGPTAAASAEQHPDGGDGGAPSDASSDD